MTMQPANRPQRLANGRFPPGVSGNPAGATARISLDAILKDRTDAGKLADALLKLAFKPGRDQRQAIEYIYNRIAGSPKQTVSVERSDDDPGVLLMRQLWQAFSNGAVGLQEGAQAAQWIDAEYAASPLPDPSSAPTQPAVD